MAGSVTRTMPQLKVDGFLFERDVELTPGYTQTLETCRQYLYVPYRDQSKINNYDSTFLQSDYRACSATAATAASTVLRRQIK
ncbi:LPS assembly protein LptD [Shigella flexneri]